MVGRVVAVAVLPSALEASEPSAAQVREHQEQDRRLHRRRLSAAPMQFATGTRYMGDMNNMAYMARTAVPLHCEHPRP